MNQKPRRVPFDEFKLRVILKTVLPIVEKSLGADSFTVADMKAAIAESEAADAAYINQLLGKTVKEGA